MFYIRQHDATVQTYYWNQNAQNWTADPAHATLFTTKAAADAEVPYAEANGMGEAEVCVKFER